MFSYVKKITVKIVYYFLIKKINIFDLNNNKLTRNAYSFPK